MGSAVKRLVVAGALCAGAGLAGASSAEAAKTRACSPVINPYPNSRLSNTSVTRRGSTP